MNLCLIYLTEWAREICAYSAYPQRWIVSTGRQGCPHEDAR